MLFDGTCNLCHGAVQFIIRRDPRGRFRFASLQSQVATRVMAAAGVGEARPDSLVFAHGGRVRFRSAAALAIARGLRWPWPLVTVCWLVPWFLRDFVYDWIARNRHRWFGKREECWVPTKELRARFLDAGESR